MCGPIRHQYVKNLAHIGKVGRIGGFLARKTSKLVIESTSIDDFWPEIDIPGKKTARTADFLARKLPNLRISSIIFSNINKREREIEDNTNLLRRGHFK